MYDEKYGFIQVNTFKDYYFPGQIVRGYAVLTVFNELKEKSLILKVRGFEMPGNYVDDIGKVLGSQNQSSQQMNLTRAVTQKQVSAIFQ